MNVNPAFHERLLYTENSADSRESKVKQIMWTVGNQKLDPSLFLYNPRE
jgi:hypothetical protein